MTSETSELTSVSPAFAPAPRALADTELLLTGAFAPLGGFLTRADADAVRARRQLADGTPWPAPVLLDAPRDIAQAAAPGATLALEDPEGTPIASLTVADRWVEDGAWYVGGPVRPLRPAEGGVFRRLHRTPGQVRADLPDDVPVVAVLADRPFHHHRLAAVRAGAGPAAHVLLLVPTAGDRDLPPESLCRLALAAAERLAVDRSGGASVVALPLARRGGRGDPYADTLLAARVARNYGAATLLTSEEFGAMAPDSSDVRVMSAAQSGPSERQPLTDGEVDELLADGDPLPDWFTPPEVAAELRHARPPRYGRGLTVFFTGLSGAGKSTIARALHDALAERADRTVTLLDGDVVRRMLSAGLGFSREDRDRNVLRIGFVAAEVARHGGVAICAPIAPYASTRAQVRAMVTGEGGGFVLVHVSTSLEVSEARDRKGLYAKARAGLIPEFTGVSDPYEEPTDAEVTVDTAQMPVDEAVQRVLDHLTEQGWLRS